MPGTLKPHRCCLLSSKCHRSKDMGALITPWNTGPCPQSHGARILRMRTLPCTATEVKLVTLHGFTRTKGKHLK